MDRWLFTYGHRMKKHAFPNIVILLVLLTAVIALGGSFLLQLDYRAPEKGLSQELSSDDLARHRTAMSTGDTGVMRSHEEMMRTSTNKEYYIRLLLADLSSIDAQKREMAAGYLSRIMPYGDELRTALSDEDDYVTQAIEKQIYRSAQIISCKDVAIILSNMNRDNEELRMLSLKISVQNPGCIEIDSLSKQVSLALQTYGPRPFGSLTAQPWRVRKESEQAARLLLTNLAEVTGLERLRKVEFYIVDDGSALEPGQAAHPPH